MKPTSIALIVVLFFGCAPGINEVKAQPGETADFGEVDEYGGWIAMPCDGGPRGVFYTERASERWRICSPSGNTFWMRSVYAVSKGDGGPAYSQALASKYPSGGAAAAQMVQRLKTWGFNAIGPYYGLGSQNVLPVSTFNAKPSPVKLPFLRGVEFSGWCMRNPQYRIKNLYAGSNAAVYSIGRDFPDVFDPQWGACAASLAVNGDNSFTPPLTKEEPYMIGTWIGDGDRIFGFGRGPNTTGGPAHAHLGWIAATTSPTQSKGPYGDMGYLYDYYDDIVYAKQAWRTFLEDKYQTVEALNGAWGSDYTSFGSSEAGWPRKTTGGTGVLDEDGSSPWVGRGVAGLTGANPNFATDADEFLTQIADSYFGTIANALRSAYPNHLVFGPGSVNTRTYTQVLQKAGQYLDVVEVWVQPMYVNELAEAYNTMGKPLLVWTTLQAQPDSPTVQGWGPPASSCDELSNYNYANQTLRGDCYKRLLTSYAGIRGTDSLYGVVGINWWEWTDKTVGGENANFGLVTNRDNAYDGREAVVAPGADPWGYTTGGESRDYGDFISGVISGHSSLWRQVRLQSSGTGPVSRRLRDSVVRGSRHR